MSLCNFEIFWLYFFLYCAMYKKLDYIRQYILCVGRNIIKSGWFLSKFKNQLMAIHTSWKFYKYFDYNINLFKSASKLLSKLEIKSCEQFICDLIEKCCSSFSSFTNFIQGSNFNINTSLNIILYFSMFNCRPFDSKDKKFLVWFCFHSDKLCRGCSTLFWSTHRYNWNWFKCQRFRSLCSMEYFQILSQRDLCQPSQWPGSANCDYACLDRPGKACAVCFLLGPTGIHRQNQFASNRSHKFGEFWINIKAEICNSNNVCFFIKDFSKYFFLSSQVLELYPELRGFAIAFLREQKIFHWDR